MAIRLLMAFPHLFAFGLVGVGAALAALVGWIGAVFTGELAPGIDRFLRRYVGYGARVYGYLGFLTDRYPAFDLPVEGADDYPVRVIFGPRVPLNRVLVLFRLVLMIPVWVVYSVLTAGWALASVVMWLVVLGGGLTPPTLWEANTSALRYLVRVWSYGLMLTDAYPRGLFTGGTLEPVPSGAGGAAPAPPWSATDDVIVGRRSGTAASGALSSGARALLIVFLVVGSAYYGVAFVRGFIAGRNSPAVVLVHLEQDHQRLAQEAEDFQAQAQGCRAQADPRGCAAAASAVMVGDFHAFAQEVRNLHFPDQDQAAALNLAVTSDLMATDLDLVSQGGGPGAVVQFQNTGAQFDQQFQSLVVALRAAA